MNWLKIFAFWLMLCIVVGFWMLIFSGPWIWAVIAGMPAVIFMVVDEWGNRRRRNKRKSIN